MNRKNLLTLSFACLVPMLGVCGGCAEGILWKTGRYTPWAQKQWAEEEKIADTLFARKRLMTEATESVANAPVEQQQQVAQKLAEVVERDPVLLLRLHAINLLGELNCPAANSALAGAINDQESDIRVAAVNAFKNMPADVAVPQLQRVIGGDSNIDVRLAATRTLGSFTGEQAVSALSLALNDPDPALQLRAAESLQNATGESIGSRHWRVAAVRSVILARSNESGNACRKPRRK